VFNLLALVFPEMAMTKLPHKQGLLHPDIWSGRRKCDLVFKLAYLSLLVPYVDQARRGRLLGEMLLDSNAAYMSHLLKFDQQFDNLPLFMTGLCRRRMFEQDVEQFVASIGKV
jgi:hypothetical protein